MMKLFGRQNCVVEPLPKGSLWDKTLRAPRRFSKINNNVLSGLGALAVKYNINYWR
jgi:hypothetical protein